MSSNNKAVIRRVSLLVHFVCVFSMVQGQDTNTSPEAKKILTLDDCLTIALDNNIQLKRAKNNAAAAKSNDFQAIMNFLPSVNAFANYQFSSGSNFDNNSGNFVTGNLQNSGPGVQANWTIFNGFNNIHYKKTTAKNLESSANQIRAQEQQVQSTVLGFYLAVVLDKENINISNARIQLLEAQLTRAEKRQSVGVDNLEQVYNLRSQLASEKLNLVNIQNLHRSDMLSLLQSLQLNTLQGYDLAPYDFESEQDLTQKDNFSAVLDKSLSYSPNIKSAEASAEAAKFNHKFAQTGMMPTLSLVGYYGTNYSSRNVDASAVEIPRDEQYRNLTAKSVNVQLNIPIFNNHRARTGAQTARVNMENALLDLEQTELTVTNTVQQVYLDLISAQASYGAAIENLNQLNQAFEFVKARYDNGATDFYTYLESLNNKNQAEIQLVNAKYSIVFRKKILDVYRGML